MSNRKSKSTTKSQDEDQFSSGQVLTCLPWQRNEFERILRQEANGKLSHALLVSGQAFLGKFPFALSIASGILCEGSDDQSRDIPGAACGECAGCHLVAAGTHPDFRVLKPEDSKLIKIEQIREVIGWIGQAAQRSGKKVVIVHPADQMTHQSANALLKCLEEPAGNSLIMLVTSHPGRLLPTIRSRCQLVEFHIPPKEVAINWLQEQQGTDATRDAEILLAIAGGAPLAVVNRFDEAFLERRGVVVISMVDLVCGKKNAQQVSELLSKAGAADAIDCMYDILIDCLKYISSNELKFIRNKDMASVIEEICARYDLDALFELSESLKVARQELTSSSNPDPVLLIESVVISLKSHLKQVAHLR